jgi:hypothetical protein
LRLRRTELVPAGIAILIFLATDGKLAPYLAQCLVNWAGSNKQDRQCTYNVTLRHVRATIFAVEIQLVLHMACVCSLRYTACSAHASYCSMWSAQLYNIFPHYLINGAIFEKKRKLLNIKCVIGFFPTTFV